MDVVTEQQLEGVPQVGFLEVVVAPLELLQLTMRNMLIAQVI